MSTPTPRIAGPIVSLILAASLVGCSKNDEPKFELPTDTQSSGPRTVKVTPVTVEQHTDPVRATGTTLAPSTTKVMPLVPGLILSLPVKEGQMINKNQVIARLDQRGFRLGLRQARAAVEGAKVMLDAMDREKKRFEELYKSNATPKSQYEQILDKYRGAAAGYKQATVALDMAKKAMGDSVIRAPYRGMVYKKLASVGDYATAMPPTVLIVLMDLSRLDLNISLPERELTRVKVGDTLSAEFPNLDKTLEVKVARIVRMVDPVSRSFTAIAEIPNDDMSMRAGLFARVTLQAGKSRRRMLVPRSAVLDEGAGIFSVFVVEGNVAKRKVVKVTESGEQMIEVVTGLSGNETAITDPSGLVDGDPIKVTAEAGKKAQKNGGGAEAAR